VPARGVALAGEDARVRVGIEPAPVAGAAPSSTVAPRAVEAPAPAAVNPQPVPVAAPTSEPEVAPQNPDEVIGRQIDGPNGERCVVVDADLTVTCEPAP